MNASHRASGATPRNRWDGVVWATALAGLALLALAVGSEWKAARESAVPVFANPRIAITDTADTSLPIAVVASQID